MPLLPEISLKSLILEPPLLIACLSIFLEFKIILKHSILLKAISKGGSSIRDFKDTLGLKGGFQNEFKVYQQEGIECKNVGCSDLIRKKIISNRSTFFCDSCQK